MARSITLRASYLFSLSRKCSLSRDEREVYEVTTCFLWLKSHKKENDRAMVCCTNRNAKEKPWYVAIIAMQKKNQSFYGPCNRKRINIKQIQITMQDRSPNVFSLVSHLFNTFARC